MRLGLISDVHADPIALELAWAHLTVMGADRIVCVGDLIGYGPSPDRVAEFLQERQVTAIRGNHDRWALERGPGVRDPYGVSTPSAATLDYLRSLSSDVLVAHERSIGVVVHGSPRSDMEFVNRSSHPPAVLRQYLSFLDCNLLVVGHTHRPMWYRCPEGLVLNPGSAVSMPVVDSSRSFAMVDLESLEPTFYDVDSGEPIAVAPWN